MIISVQCPACQTSFPVDPRKVPDGGVKVRCSACSGIFFVEKPALPPPSAPMPPAPDPVPEPVGPAPEVRETGAGPAAAALGAATAGTAKARDDDPAAEPTAGRAEPDPVAEAAGWDEPATAADPTRDVAPPVPSPEPEGDNVDPWSGAGWDDPAEMGAPHDGGGADPWSGGMGLDDDEGDETPAPDEGDWVIERATRDPFAGGEPEVERLDTVEEQVRAAAAEWDDGAESAGDDDAGWDEAELPPAAEAPIEGAEAVWASEAAEPGWDSGPAEPAAPSAGEEAETEGRIETVEPAVEVVDEAADALSDAVEEAAGDPFAHPGEAPAEAPVEAPTEATAPESPVDSPPVDAPAETTGFRFGKRDPHDKARRLARVLVSDIITYNPERHQRALQQDTLHADFEDEIKKSWAEYVEQVGRDIAESTSYWFDALNEILARGRKVF